MRGMSKEWAGTFSCTQPSEKQGTRLVVVRSEATVHSADGNESVPGGKESDPGGVLVGGVMLPGMCAPGLSKRLLWVSKKRGVVIGV